MLSYINLTTFLWTDGECYLPVDYLMYNKSADGLTKNDHFLAMLKTAAERGFTPEFVLFDTWYASLKNLKFIRFLGWFWLIRLECSRHVNPDQTGNRPIKILSDQVDIVHFKGYGLIKMFKVVKIKDDIEYWATNDLKMTDLLRLKYAEISSMIETYHRGINYPPWGGVIYFCCADAL